MRGFHFRPADATMQTLLIDSNTVSRPPKSDTQNKRGALSASNPRCQRPAQERYCRLAEAAQEDGKGRDVRPKKMMPLIETR